MSKQPNTPAAPDASDDDDDDDDDDDGDEIFLTINLPVAIQPIERGERFEDPLEDALGDLGYVDGGGTLMSAGGVIESADIEVVVTDLDRAIPIILTTLRRLGAPPATTITCDDQTWSLRDAKEA